MSFDDPFASAPAATAPATAAPAAPAPQASAVSSSDEALTITLKESGGFDAAWRVSKAPTVDDALSKLNEAKAKRLMETTKAMAGEFRAGDGGNGGRQAPQRQQQQQAAPAAAPASELPGDNCPHGRTHKEGVSKAGKPYSAYFCTAPRGQQCDPIWGKPPQAQQNGPIPF